MPLRPLWNTAFLLLTLSPATVCFAQVVDEHRPLLEGFVTDAGSPTAFRVNDVPVSCTPGQTRFLAPSADGKLLLGVLKCPQLRVGQSVRIEGKRLKKHAGVAALEVTDVVQNQQPVEGVAMIDRVLSPLQHGEVTLRADGLPLLLTSRTDLAFDPGIATDLSAAQPNTWITYRGNMAPDGTVHISWAGLSPNIVDAGEDKLRQKVDFDAAAVADEDRQTIAARYLLGMDPKRLPAYHDAAMQARLDTIGRRLVPAYQAKLPVSDPTRIDFRFQLIDEHGIHDALALPSGIILVPYQVVQELENDSQLAEVLADSIACILEKRQLRALPVVHALQASSVIGLAAGLAIPGGSLPFAIGNTAAASVMMHHIIEQDSRVSLALMQDAGFDLREAPRAYWVLSRRGKHPLSETDMSYHVRYLYTLLFQVWQKPLAASGQAAQ